MPSSEMRNRPWSSRLTATLVLGILIAAAVSSVRVAKSNRTTNAESGGSSRGMSPLGDRGGGTIRIGEK